MPCLHHTNDDGPEEYYVTPFDPAPRIKCQCPGDCPGTIVLWAASNGHFAFLQCDVCGCGYVAADEISQRNIAYRKEPSGPKATE